MLPKDPLFMPSHNFVCTILSEKRPGHARQDAQKIAKLEDEAKEPAKRLAEDIKLFSSRQGSA